MDSIWELPKPPASFNRAHAFEELLERLRSMYEEVCAENTHLELTASGIRENGHANSKEFDSVPKELSAASSQNLSLTGVAKMERPLLTPKTPRNPVVSLVSPVTSLGNPAAPSTNYLDLTKNIGNLAVQQELLTEKINEIIQSTQKRPAFRSRVSVKSASQDLRTSRRQSQGSAETYGESDKIEWNTEARRSRFAVSSGGTANSSFFGDWGQVSRRSSMALLRPRIRRLLNSTRFSLFILFLIFSYAIFVAIETEVISQDPGMESLAMKVVHYIYNAIFFVELAIRFIADGCSTFKGKEGPWNRIDAFLVLSALIEICMEIIAAGSGSADKAMGVARIVRIARVVRTVRLLRTFTQFHEFQKMAYALMSSLKTLICSLAILIFVMFVFAVGLTRSAADVKMREQIQDLELRYGNLRFTTYTLFLSVSNGISWDYAYMPLYHLSWSSAMAFIIYINITMFGVLNVVTSIFVESVTRSVQHYKDLIVQDKEVERQIAISHVKEVFYHVDSDHSGEVTIDELEYFLSEPSLRKYMEALDIDAEDTRLLFRLLDRDNSRIISLEEFCEGCLRLKGNARSIDVQTMMFQMRNFLSKWSEFTGFVEDSFSHLRQILPQNDDANSIASYQIISEQGDHLDASPGRFSRVSRVSSLASRDSSPRRMSKISMGSLPEEAGTHAVVSAPNDDVGRSEF